MTDSPPTAAARAHLLLLSCVVIWGFSFVATKICVAVLEPVAIVGLRFLIGLPLLLAIVVLRRRRWTFVRGDIPALALGSAVIATHFLIQAVALNYTSAGNTSWIIAVSPLVIAWLARLVLHEPASPRLWAGIVAATAGVLILVSHGDLARLGGLHSIGEGLVLLSAGTWAVYTIATRNLSRSRDPLVVALAVHAPLLVLCWGSMLVRGDVPRLSALPPAAVAALLFLGVLGTTAQWFWQEGTARVGAARAGLYMYLEPLATLALAVPLLGEDVGWFTLVGGALILGGVAWAQQGRAA